MLYYILNTRPCLALNLSSQPTENSHTVVPSSWANILAFSLTISPAIGILLARLALNQVSTAASTYGNLDPLDFFLFGSISPERNRILISSAFFNQVDRVFAGTSAGTSKRHFGTAKYASTHKKFDTDTST